MSALKTTKNLLFHRELKEEEQFWASKKKKTFYDEKTSFRWFFDIFVVIGGSAGRMK